jgi:hypothetical protein
LSGHGEFLIRPLGIGGIPGSYSTQAALRHGQIDVQLLTAANGHMAVYLIIALVIQNP